MPNPGFAVHTVPDPDGLQIRLVGRGGMCSVVPDLRWPPQLVVWTLEWEPHAACVLGLAHRTGPTFTTWINLGPGAALGTG